MTEKFYRLETYKPDHSIYAGEITKDDFNTCSPNKKRINKYIDTMKYMNEKKEEWKIKNMAERYTLEELKEMRLISNTNGRPVSYLTDEKWQKEFKLRKMFIKPYPKHKNKLDGKYSMESGKWNNVNGEYKGCTNWQQYCSYINDVLRNIKSGQIDYCYYIYQIEELAKFYYCNQILKTQYCDGYWKVWLERY